MAIRARKGKKGTSYQVDVEVGGQRVKKSLGPGSTKSQARQLETKIKRELIDGTQLGKKDRKLLDDAVARWVEENQDLKWIKSASNHIEQVKDLIEGAYLDEANRVAEQVKERARARNWSAATTNRRLSIIRRVANLAYKEWDWLDQPVGDKITMTRGEKSREVFLSQEDVWKIADSAGRSDVRDLILMAAYTGMRLGELFKLDPEESIEDGWIVLRGAQTKTEKPRAVPIHKDIAEVVERAIPFTRSEKYYNKWFRKAADEAGFPHVRFHDLRHTNASWLAKAGVHPTAIRDLLGHSSLSVTSKYSHLFRDQLQDAVGMIQSRESDDGE